VLIAAAVAVALGGVAALSALQMTQLKHQLTVRQQKILELGSQNAQLQQQLADIEEERKALDGRLSDLRGQLASTTGELGRLKSSMSELQARYDALESEKVDLEDQVSQLEKERDDVMRQIRRLKTEKTDLEREAGRLRERLTILERDAEERAKAMEQSQQQASAQPAAASIPRASPAPSGSPAVAIYPPVAEPARGTAGRSPATQAGSKTVELPPIVVRKDRARSDLPVRGRVVELNDTYRFIVVDKGTNDGVRVGMIFNVVRGAGVIGQVVAVRVRPQLAACDLVSSSGSFQIGDLIVQHGP
jgi:cell shape-determining protein MreC